jgi:hypothetical protein
VNFPLLFSTITAFIIGQGFAILSFFRQMSEKDLKHRLLFAARGGNFPSDIFCVTAFAG